MSSCLVGGRARAEARIDPQSLRHALLHMAPKWFDHWTTWAGRRCSNEAKMRNPLKFAGVPQSRQPMSAVSEPKFTMRTCG